MKKQSAARQIMFTEQELLAVIYGACFLGCGGGGGMEMALKLLESLRELRSNFPVVRLEDVEDDAQVCIVAGIGSPRAAMQQNFLQAICHAFEGLEKQLQVKFTHTMASETGGFNSIAPFAVTAVKGLSVIDADGAGRSIPQIDMLPFSLEVLRCDGLLTAVIANEHGAKQVVQGRDKTELDENLRQAISGNRELFNECAGIAFFAMTGRDVKVQAVPGTLSTACHLGQTMTKGKAGFWACEPGLKLLASGIIMEIKEETHSGFDFGRVWVKGDQGEEYVVNYKNENLIIWRGQEVLATAPDLVCCATKSGEPRTNVEIRVGDEVCYFGRRAAQQMQDTQIVDVFQKELRKMGYDGGYVCLSE